MLSNHLWKEGRKEGRGGGVAIRVSRFSLIECLLPSQMLVLGKAVMNSGMILALKVLTVLVTANNSDVTCCEAL